MSLRNPLHERCLSLDVALSGALGHVDNLAGHSSVCVSRDSYNPKQFYLDLDMKQHKCRLQFIFHIVSNSILIFLFCTL